MDDILLNISEGERLTLGISSILSLLTLRDGSTILLEALQELSLDVLLHEKVGLALLFGELIHCIHDDVFLVDL